MLTLEQMIFIDEMKAILVPAGLNIKAVHKTIIEMIQLNLETQKN
jgi:hypothetical protein